MKTLCSVFTAAMVLAGGSLSASPSTTASFSKWRVTPATRASVQPEPDAWWQPKCSALPANWHASAAKNGVALPPVKEVFNIWIEGKVLLPDGARSGDSQFEIEFPSIGGNLVVYMNGQLVGERLGPFGFLDVTGFVHDGENTLRCFATTDYTDVSQKPEDDILRTRGNSGNFKHHPRLGILSEPILHIRPRPAALRDVWTECNWEKRELSVRHEIVATHATEGWSIHVDVFEEDGKKAIEFDEKNLSLAPGIQTVDVRRIWQDVHPWDIDDGHLYRLKCSLRDEQGRERDVHETVFGFREVGVDGRNVVLNGHPLHLRIEMAWFKLKRETLPWFRQLGLNSYYIQPHPNNWFRLWHEVPDFHAGRNSGVIDLCDKEGIALFLPVVTASNLLKANDAVWKTWQDCNRYFMRAYRKHPSVLAWCVSMNAFNPSDAIAPQNIGIRRTVESYNPKGGDWPCKARQVQAACRFVKELDPSRLVYGHGEGCVGGDFATANNYPNMTPAQEVEDYPEIWTKCGDMPYFACEYGTYDGSYFKQFKKCLITEYAAIYQGARAYEEETQDYRDKLIEAGLKNNGYGQTAAMMASLSPAYDTLEEISQRATARGWRTAGMLGWHRFHGARYGNASNKTVNAVCAEKYMQPFYAYVGGSPDCSDKTHVYAPGEKVEKQIVSMWDSGRGPCRVRSTWRLVAKDGGKCFAEQSAEFELKPFGIAKHPVSFKAPESGEYVFEAVFEADGRESRDSFDISVLSNPEPAACARRIVLFDPKGESQWVKELYPDTVDFSRGMELDPATDIFVIGRRAVDDNSSQPHTPEQVEAGLRVLYLEQMPAVWDLFGLDRNADVFARQAFFAVASPSNALKRLYEGISEDMLSYWRGTPTLVPEYRYTRSNVCGAPKGSGRNAIASTVFEIPEAPSYRPLFACEFDMNFTPLLEWDCGSGCVVFNSFDLTGRVGVDPAATRLARNLFAYLAEVRPAATTPEEKIDLRICASEEDLKRAGIAYERRRAWILKPEGELAAVVGQNLLRWRDYLDYVAITEPGAELGGAWYRRGTTCYLQLGPQLLESRYADEPDGFRQCAVDLSVIRLHQLVGRVKGHLGAAPSAELKAVAAKTRSAGFVDIPQWNLLGPFDGLRYNEVFAKKHPGEDAALTGDLNPNIDYLMNGRTFNFRKQASPDARGYVDVRATIGLPEDLKGTYFAFAVAETESETERDALVAMNLLGWAKLYLNGEPVVDFSDGGFRQQSLDWAVEDPGAYRFRVHLKKGRNIFAFKIQPPKHQQKTADVGFFLKLSEDGYDLSQPFGSAPRSAPIYNDKLRFGAAYGYHAW